MPYCPNFVQGLWLYGLAHVLEHARMPETRWRLIRRLAVVALSIGIPMLPLASASAASVANAPVFANWPQSRFDLANSGSNPNEAVLDATNASQLRQAWVRSDDESSNAAPAVVNNVIYIGCGAALCAIDAADQVLTWKSRIPSGSIAYSAPAVSQGLVYAGTNGSGAVYAFDIRTGAIRWSFQTAGHDIWAGPSVAGNTVYVGGDDQNLYALDASTGVKRWSFNAGNPIDNTPAVVNGVVYVGAGGLDAISATDGHLLWSGLSATDGVTASPAVAGGRVFIGAYSPGSRGNPNFYAFNASGCGATHCTPLWSAVIGLPPPSVGELDGIQSSAAVGNGSVYVGAPDGKIYALDPADGAVRWAGQTHGSQITAQEPNPTPIPASPAVANGVVYVTSYDGYVYAYPASGCAATMCSWLFSASLDGGQGNGYESNCWNTTTSSPVVVNGYVYVGGCVQTYSGALYAFTVFPCPPGNPPAGGQYHPLDHPSRILDTRNGDGPIGPGEARSLLVAGQGGIPPTGVSAALLNVAVTDTTAPSYLTVYPSTATRPLAANLNWSAHQTVANLVEVPLGADGSVDLFNASGSTDVVVDAQGWVQSAVSTAAYGHYLNPTAPYRVLDTRDGTGGPDRPLGAGATITVQADSGTSSGVVLDLAVTNASRDSYLTVWMHGASRPDTANINFTAGQTVANRVVVGLGVGGLIDIYNAAGSVDVIADLNGQFREETSNATAGCRLTPVTPARILDTRDGTGGVVGPVGPRQSVAVQVAGMGGVPLMTAAIPPRAVILNITATAPSAPSYLTAWPDGLWQPTTSDLNFAAGQTVPNLVIVEVGADGKIDIYNASGQVQVIADVSGWFG